jgi:predicted Zn finger-like uncharacterized protein
MIIACPACNTRYVVPDSAIGIEGRTVRCAKCRHSWFQDGPPLRTPEDPAPALAPDAAPPAAEVPPAPPPAPRHDPVQDDEPEAGPAAERAQEPEAPVPEPEEPAPIAAPPVYAEPEPADVSDDADSQFDYEPPFRPRRNPAKMWMIAAVLSALVSLSAVAATAYYGLPGWIPLARPTFAEKQPDLKLDFPAKRQDRHQLPNGTWFFGASGTVTNLGQTARSVPSVLIVLRDSRGRIVYSWEVIPPKRVLAPGESVTINEAVTDVPKSAVRAEFGWKPG